MEFHASPSQVLTVEKNTCIAKVRKIRSLPIDNAAEAIRNRSVEGGGRSDGWWLETPSG